MSVAIAEEPRLLHEVPGRVRLHVPAWSGAPAPALDSRLRRIQGVRSAQANPLTGNVLVRFDPAVTTVETILEAVRSLGSSVWGDAVDGLTAAQTSPPTPARAPRVLQDRTGGIRRARIAVRGMDRDPGVARRVVERLRQYPGVVLVRASPLTGRVLVEFSAHRVEIDDLLAEVAEVELPPLPDEDRPAHPLDPAPLLQSASRTIGAALGLGLLVARQVAGAQGPPPGAARAATTAAIIGLVQGFPLTRNGLRALLGRDASDLLFSGAAIVALTLAGSPLGLAITGAEALRLLTEVLARRAAWRRYTERLASVAAAEPGAVIRLEAGERAPLAATVVEGTGTALGDDGLPIGVRPGALIPAGARLFGGPCVVELQGPAPFLPRPRPAPASATLYDRYQAALGPASLAYAALTALITRSPARTLAALLLVNPRTALIGAEAATTGAAARVLRAGVIVVGTRPDRPVRLPDVLLMEGPRVLTDGLELASVRPVSDDVDPAEVLACAAGVAAAAGSPWGRAFPAADAPPATDGAFDGTSATANVEGLTYRLGPLTDVDVGPAVDRHLPALRERGTQVLVLRRAAEEQPRALFALRPRLAAGVADLVQACRRHGVELGLFGAGDASAAASVAARAGVPLLDGGDAAGAIRARQESGDVVAFLADQAHAAAAFAACDLAIGLTSGRSGRFPARADLLAPDLHGVTAIIEAGAQRRAAVRDAVGLSLVANVAGAVWGFRGAPGVERASLAVNVTAFAALADGWARLRGGERPPASIVRLVDPRPERWGRRRVADVLRAFDTTEAGLSSAQAAVRCTAVPRAARRNEFLAAILAQLRSPLTTVLAAGAGLSLVLGATADVALIGAVLVANAAVGAWQERQAGQAAQALERLSAATARVLRDGEMVRLPAAEVVPGDVLLLAPGDRIAADARLLEATGLEVDEAALTGESLLVPKAPTGGTDASRVVLEGSDVLVGTGRAVVVAVGPHTRMGATAAALALQEMRESPLGQRLSGMLREMLPLIAAGGAVVFAAGLLRGQPLLPQLALGASIAVAVVPEGLPLLAGMAEAAVARRLAGQRAFVRRLAAVEALGRVDVACADKTGTMTEGRLALTVVATCDRDARLGGASDAVLPADLSAVLRAAALASPHPDAADAGTHPTDMAVVKAAEVAGLGADARAVRTAEAPFDPVQSFHAAVVGNRLYAKGAVEALLSRCSRVRCGGTDQTLDEEGRDGLQARAEELAARGLRVLMVAEGAAEVPVDDPQELVALGFVGISDPLRPDVPLAVQRCHDAGVSVIMLTGDHPTTARTIAREAGLLDGGDGVLTGADIAELDDGELDRRLERATVIARVTPLDKLRIVESLQRRGHTVAMTGDGVNDAPALRLADVGVAMGRGGTEVARQAADVVLADDEFATLVEALVEGRGFWRNIRRALGLLLGGNLGEFGLVVGASALGLVAPLTVRQILAVNVVTDVLPSLAVALQQPEHRNLAGLAREGASALGTTLRQDVVRRGGATAGPALAAYLVALRSGGLPQARAVAFASIVATQLSQTLDLGRVEGGLSRSVLGAVGGSAGALVAALTVPPLRAFLGLATPTPLGWTLIGAGAVAAMGISRVFSSAGGADPGRPALPAPPHLRLLPPPREA